MDTVSIPYPSAKIPYRYGSDTLFAQRQKQRQKQRQIEREPSNRIALRLRFHGLGNEGVLRLRLRPSGASRNTGNHSRERHQTYRVSRLFFRSKINACSDWERLGQAEFLSACHFISICFYLRNYIVLRACRGEFTMIGTD